MEFRATDNRKAEGMSKNDPEFNEAKEDFDKFIEEMSVPFDGMGTCCGPGIFKEGPAVYRKVISSSGEQGKNPIAILECGHNMTCVIDCLADNPRNRKRAIAGVPPRPCGWLLCDANPRCIQCEDLDALQKECSL